MLKSIQILRAIAALLVVFAHFEITKPAIGGFGVDIFFVISGFIMAYIVNKNPDAFMYRRLVRILPLYYLMTLLTTTLFLLKPSWFRHVIVTPEALAKSLLFIPYRIKGSGPILSLGWTLNYEMFFYISIAICISLFGAKNAIKASFGLLVLFVILVFAIKPDIYMIQYWGNNIILEFIGGGLLYYFWKSKTFTNSATARNGMILTGMAAFIFLLFADYAADPSSTRFLLFGIPSLLLANAFLHIEGHINQQNKVHSTMILLGDSSYAMYLVHPFVIYAFLRLVFNRLHYQGLIFEILGLILSMLMVCIVSILLHKYFEKPVIKLLKSLLDKRFDAPKPVSKS